MSARIFDEIKAAASLALQQNDLTALDALLSELSSFDSTQAQAFSIRLQGKRYSLQGNHSKALECFHESLALYETLDDAKSVAEVSSVLGSTYWAAGVHDKALEYLQRALALHEAGKNWEGLGAATSNIALIFAGTGDFAKALEYFHKALKLHVEVGNRFYQANTIGNLAWIYHQTHEYDSALTCSRNSLELHRELGDKKGESSSMVGLGAIYASLNDFDEAERWIKEAINVAVESGMVGDVASHCCTLASLFVQMHRYDEALKLLDHNAKHFEGDSFSHTYSLQIRAQIFVERGEYDVARELLTQALEKVITRNSRPLIADCCKALRNIAKAQGDFESYVSYNERYQEINEEVRGTEAMRRVAVQEREREFDLQRREHEKHMAVLHSTLPKHIADRVARGETVNDPIDHAAVIFIDIVGFTTLTSTLTHEHTSKLLTEIFGICDVACANHNVTRIKTIGDSYMAFS